MAQLTVALMHLALPFDYLDSLAGLEAARPNSPTVPVDNFVVKCLSVTCKTAQRRCFDRLMKKVAVKNCFKSTAYNVFVDLCKVSFSLLSGVIVFAFLWTTQTRHLSVNQGLDYV